MAANDYRLTIEEVARRLNKSTRTIHRYKDGGRLTFEVGASQGNPLLFSEAEVAALQRELFPRGEVAAPWGDPGFLARLERMERLLGQLERNSLLARIAGLVHGPGGEADDELVEALHHLTALEATGAELDRKELGAALLRLGHALNAEPEA